MVNQPLSSRPHSQTSGPLRLAVLGDCDGWYVRDLQRAAGEVGYQLECVSFQQLKAEIVDSEPAASSLGIPSTNLCEFDAVLVRTMPLGSLEEIIFRIDCLQILESRQVPVLNPPRCLEVAIDKWLTLHRLASHGLPVPSTVVCQQKEEAMAAFDALGGDVVVKPLFGGEGRGMLRLDDKDMAWRAFGTLRQLRSVAYIQQFQEHYGYDIRVLLIGDRCYSIKRISKPDTWRTNISMGSCAASHQLTQQQRDMAFRAADALAGEARHRTVLGVDLLPCKDGVTRVLEVNAVPGWRALGKVLEVDVAADVLKFLSGLVASRIGG